MIEFTGATDNGREARTLEIAKHHAGVNLYIQRPTMDLGIVIEAADIPAVMLAMVEAAGVERIQFGVVSHGSPDHLQDLAWSLGQYIKFKAIDDAAATKKAAQEAKEAADRAELEAEALAFRNAFLAASRLPQMDEINVHHYDYKQWVAVARAARARLSKP